ncbi:hypothetical protein ACJX0J_008020, partial [Zea mays]
MICGIRNRNRAIISTNCNSDLFSVVGCLETGMYIFGYKNSALPILDTADFYFMMIGPLTLLKQIQILDAVRANAGG